MKHQVYGSLLLLICVSVQADFNAHSSVDKSERIGRFSYEDSFDEKLVEKILKNSSQAVRKNVQRLLYPDEDEDMQRLLLLGGASNAATVAIAKAIAMRCGYEYYVIEASALVRAYREGRQTLLSEVRPIIKQGKPIAIIITELAEMVDYSGVLASTLWLLIDQCAQYQDVCVIATSSFKRGELSEEIKDRFGRDIISIDLDKKMQGSIEKEILNKKTSWFERNKTACCVMGGLACFALGVAHLYAQWLFANAQAERDNKRMLLENTMIVLLEAILSRVQEQCDKQQEQFMMQNQQCEKQEQQCAMQKQQNEKQDLQYEMQKKQFAKQEEQCNKQYAMQKEQFKWQLIGFIRQMQQLDSFYVLECAYSDNYLQKTTKERTQAIQKVRDDFKAAEDVARKRSNEI